MAHRDLTSHHVNYLIWRYLQESGHGEAAVELQRAWYHDPQSLPFAPYIKSQALVNLVQKGLQYYELEQSLDKDGNHTPFSHMTHFFGPVPLEPETLNGRLIPNETVAGTEQISEPFVSNDLPEGGLSNGHLAIEPVAPPSDARQQPKGDGGDIKANEEPMEIEPNGLTHDIKAIPPGSPKFSGVVVDGDGDVKMSVPPSDAQIQQAAAPLPTFTLSIGQSVGVQITPAKAADVCPNTTVFNVSSSGHVTRTSWRPNDPTIVVASGDTFCSLWKLSSPSGSSHERLIESKGGNICVSAVSWKPTGQKLAVATYNDMRGSITMYDVEGNAVDLLPEMPRMITGLHWAESSSHLVVVASDSKISELALWDDSLRPDEFPSPVLINGPIYDLAWMGQGHAYACGDGSVYECEVNSSIRIAKTFTSRADTAWSFIRCAGETCSPVVVTASSATAAIWIPTHGMRLDSAHQSEITAIEFRPQSRTDVHDPFVLASSSTDGTINVWNVDIDSKSVFCTHRMFLEPSMPALAMGFSTDGFLLAAAGKECLFIWNAERRGPATTWKIPGSELIKSEQPNGTSNEQNGNVDFMLDRCLAWDTDSKKLALGFGNEMAILNLQR